MKNVWSKAEKVISWAPMGITLVIAIATMLDFDFFSDGDDKVQTARRLGTVLVGVAVMQVSLIFAMHQLRERTNATEQEMLRAFRDASPGSLTFHDSTKATFVALLAARENSTEVWTMKLSTQPPRKVLKNGDWGDWLAPDIEEMKEWYDEQSLKKWLIANPARQFRRVFNAQTQPSKEWHERTMSAFQGVARFEQTAGALGDRIGLVVTIFDRKRLFITFSHSDDNNRYAKLKSIEMNNAACAESILAGYWEPLRDYARGHQVKP